MTDLPLKKAFTVRHYATQTVSWDDDGWLYIRKDDRLTLETNCHLTDWSSRDLRDEEKNEMENHIDAAGFKLFLLWSQLNDIERNLHQQKPGYTDEDLELAVQYYWTNDAFKILG